MRLLAFLVDDNIVSLPLGDDGLNVQVVAKVTDGSFPFCLLSGLLSYLMIPQHSAPHLCPLPYPPPRQTTNTIQPEIVVLLGSVGRFGSELAHAMQKAECLLAGGRSLHCGGSQPIAGELVTPAAPAMVLKKLMKRIISFQSKTVGGVIYP